MDPATRTPIILRGSAPRAIEWTAERIREGGVVALPTDTVYGIAASLSREDALDRIFAIKGRPSGRPLPILISSAAALTHLTTSIDDDILLLLERYWPGPLTVAIPARPGMPASTLAADGTIGVRLPNHPLAIEVIERAGGAVACTSANRSGEPPARDAASVADALGADLDLILDGGAAPGGEPSTVVAVAGGDIRVVRDGAIPAEHLLAAWRGGRIGA